MVKVGISSDHFYLNSMSILTSSRFLQKSSSWTVTLRTIARYSTQYSAQPGVQRPFFYIGNRVNLNLQRYKVQKTGCFIDIILYYCEAPAVQNFAAVAK